MRDADLAASYDSVPYESNPLRPTHPRNLAVMARLAGFAPPDLAGCRVLEIGCATGGNLLPMAESLPGATLVGVDLSPAQIAMAQAVVRALELRDVELHAASITDVAFAPGSFDYVICHGVYSWVPQEVQAAILRVCGRVLAPNGIAYVSYNTYPGWHLRSMVRDMLLHHVRDVVAPRERIRASREFVEQLRARVHDRDSAYGRAIAEEATLLAKASDTYVFHEHLETDNRPVYFHEFAASARAHGLEYLGEALAEDDEEAAGVVGDRLEQEQTRDFLRGRTFRRSLLGRAGIARDAVATPAVIGRLWLASPMRPERATVDVAGPGVEVFTGPGGRKLSIEHPWLKAAFVLLGTRWPESVPFGDLAAEIARRLGGPPPGDAMAEILRSLRLCHAGGVLVLDPGPTVATATVGERPVASALARRMGQGSLRVSSLRHDLVELREVDRRVLTLLDGTRDRADLARTLGLTDTALQESLAILRMSALLTAR